MSDVLTARVGLSADVTATIGETPAQVIATIETILSLLEQIEEGSQADNPFSGLLSVLEGLASQIGDLPDMGGALGPFSDLVDRLPGDAVGDIAQVSEQIAEITRALQPVIEAAGRGDASDTVLTLLDHNIDLVDQIGGGAGGEIQEIAGQFSHFMELFASMTRWSQQAPQVDEIVELLSNALVGAPSNLLEGPRAQLALVSADLTTLAPSGPEADRLLALDVELGGLWGGLAAQVQGEIDWPALETALTGAEAAQLEIRALRDRVIADCIRSVDGFDVPDLAPLAAALNAVPQVRPARLTPILDQLRRTIRGFADGLAGLAPTEEQLQGLLFELIDGFFGGLEESGLGQLRARLLGLQRRLIDAIRGLPLADLATLIDGALRDATRTLEAIDIEGLSAQALAPIRDARTIVEEQTQGAIADSISVVWDEVEAALTQVSQQVAALEAALRGAVSQIAGFLSEVDDAIADIEAAISEISAVLEGFNLDEPCTQVVEALAGIEAKISGIDLSVIPESARGPLKSVSAELRGIDVALSINGPIDEVLAVIDPTPLLEGAAEALTGILDELKKLDPAELIKQLDAPVDAVLEQLGKFGPEGLQTLLDAAFEPVQAAIASVDFRDLLAPIIDAQGQITNQIQGVLDPEILLEPLEAAFQPILDAIDVLEPMQYLGVVAGEGDRMGQSVGGRTGPPSSIADAGSVLRDEVNSAVDTDDDLFGFRPGDLLVPLIDLHKRLFDALDELDDGIMDAAAVRLREALNGGLEALDPKQLDAAFELGLSAVRSLCDPVRIGVALSSSATQYRTVAARISLQAGMADGTNVEVAARARLSVGRLDPLTLVPGSSQATQLESALDRARARMNLEPLRVAYAAKAPALAELLPALLAGEVNGTGLKAAISALDPAPIRDEINTAFDEFGGHLVGFTEVLFAALDSAFLRIEELFLPLTPNHLISFAGEIHRELKAQVLAIGPAALREDITPLFDAAKALLDSLDIGLVADDLNAERDAFAQLLRDLLGELLPDPAPFRELQARLAALKPSQILAEAMVELTELSETLARIDPSALIQPLIDLVARIRADLPDCIARIEEAFDAVLLELEDALSGEGGSGSVQGGISVAA